MLLPLRDEAGRVTPTIHCLLAQQGLHDLEILVLDDGSQDGTADVVRGAIGTDPRVKIIDGGLDDPPPGWLGKNWACHRLSQEATGRVLVFVDAEVQLTPHAIASAIHEMRGAGIDLLSPYPRQVAVTLPERITQPLVVWSWLATLPVDAAERIGFPSLAAAIGQFIVVDAHAYRASGGHAAVHDVVLEDVGILRALKRHGFRGAPGDGSAVASCRMYESAAEIFHGYTKSLWSAFGSATGAAIIATTMIAVYVVPPAVAVLSRDRPTRAIGALGYASGVAGRALVARTTGERSWPDSLAQPASMAAFAGLIVTSLVRRRRGTLTWKGRTI